MFELLRVGRVHGFSSGQSESFEELATPFTDKIHSNPSSFQAVEAEPAISDDPEHPLEIRYREQTSHLTDAQAHFFAKWEELIRLEEREMLKVRKEIWTMTAEERATSGRSVRLFPGLGSFFME